MKYPSQTSDIGFLLSSHIPDLARIWEAHSNILKGTKVTLDMMPPSMQHHSSPGIPCRYKKPNFRDSLDLAHVQKGFFGRFLHEAEQTVTSHLSHIWGWNERMPDIVGNIRQTTTKALSLIFLIQSLSVNESLCDCFLWMICRSFVIGWKNNFTMVYTGHVQKPKAIMSHDIGKISFQPKLKYHLFCLWSQSFSIKPDWS